RYMDEQLRSTSATSATTSMSKIPAYTVFDAMAGYTFNKNAAVNLNIYNLADKEYIQTLNSGGNRVKLGTPRSAAITLSYKF
ncbi:MAG: TonB-dependent receptor, partial [Acinetobacter sp.]